MFMVYRILKIRGRRRSRVETVRQAVERRAITLLISTTRIGVVTASAITIQSALFGVVKSSSLARNGLKTANN